MKKALKLPISVWLAVKRSVTKRMSSSIWAGDIDLIEDSWTDLHCKEKPKLVLNAKIIDKSMAPPARRVTKIGVPGNSIT